MAGAFSAYPGQPQACMNVCDLPAAPQQTGDLEQAARFVLSQSGLAGIERVCVGSYFCDRLFCSLPDAHFDAVAAFCAAYGMKATLVVPIFAQRAWKAGTERVDELLSRHAQAFDEVTVNDYATAERLSPTCRQAGMAMNWGRLFSKPLRDPRHADFAAAARTCEIDAEEVRDLRERYPLRVVELDPFAPVIDMAPLQGEGFALHLPHCLATTGHVCEAASATRPLEASFRANAACGQECAKSFTLSREEMNGAYHVKQGRTVYFENPDCRTVGAQPTRVIYSAADFRSDAGTQEARPWE